MIIVDVGNTSTTIARLRSGASAHDPGSMELERIRSVPTPRERDDRAVLAASLGGEVLEEEAIAVVSVVPEVTEALRGLPTCVVVDHRSDLPFALALDSPEATGADRYANVAAAVAMGWRDALIVDAGTATTFDVLRDGVFEGGLIAPGMAFAGEALGRAAARLEPVPFVPTPAAPGADTAAAMAAGAFQVGVHGVAGTLRRLMDVTGIGRVVLTGGLAPMLTHPEAGADLPAGVLVDSDWTLKGAAVLALRAAPPSA